MKAVMLWGAGGGIGRALVSRLSKDGWMVLTMGRHTHAIKDLTPYLFEVDVADPEAVERAITAVGQEVDQVDLWIYAAGDITASAVADVSPGTWQRILDADLVAERILAAYLDGHRGVLGL